VALMCRDTDPAGATYYRPASNSIIINLCFICG